MAYRKTRRANSKRFKSRFIRKAGKSYTRFQTTLNLPRHSPRTVYVPKARIAKRDVKMSPRAKTVKTPVTMYIEHDQRQTPGQFVVYNDRVKKNFRSPSLIAQRSHTSRDGRDDRKRRSKRGSHLATLKRDRKGILRANSKSAQSIENAAAYLQGTKKPR